LTSTIIKRLVGALAAVALALGIASVSSAPASAASTVWDRVARCESGGNWRISTGNGHYGGLQFKQATWSGNGGVGNPATAPRSEQVRVAENVLRSQGLKAWPKCGAQAGSPAVWSNPSMPTAPTVTTGCAAMPSSGLLGFINPRQVCTALLNPLGALATPR
jgi:hypothetical protein